jgi:hypothetical protein
MTVTGLPSTPPGAAPAVAGGPSVAWLRLAWLHAESRRVPAALGLLAGLGVLLWAALFWRWNIAGGPAARQFIPLTIETGAAAVVAVASYGPFGEPERATGRWLPWLRLGAAVLLTSAAFGALAAAAAGGYLPGGSLALLRNLGGITGIGLLSAVLGGGAFGWVGPMAYLLVTEVALQGHPTTPWAWASRPAGDRGAAICASLVCAAGLALITVLGPRSRARDDAGDVKLRRHGA